MSETIDRFNLLNNCLGVPKTPEQVHRRYIELGRRSGKTIAMLNALDKDSIVLTNSAYMKNIIEENTGLKIKVVVANTHNAMTILDVLNNSKLQGLDKSKIYIDNCIFDIISSNNVSAAKEYLS